MTENFMELQTTILLATLLEIILLGVVIWFFLRLKRSEDLLIKLREKQEEFVDKLSVNARLEQEMLASFEERQSQLLKLAEELERRERQLQSLLGQADEISQSPKLLRQLVLSGHSQGKSVQTLSRSTGLSPDEIELIIGQENPR
jgi:uncharacterized protein HemX